MSSIFIQRVLTQSQSKGPHRLAFMILADAADHRGEVSMSLNELASLAKVSKQRCGALIEALVATGELSIIGGKAQGRARQRYRITLAQNSTGVPETAWIREALVDPPPEFQGVAREAESPTDLVINSQESGWSSGGQSEDQLGTALSQSEERALSLSNADVVRVTAALNVPPPAGQLLFWSRQEHVADLQDVLDKRGITLDALIDQLKTARASGRTFQGQPRRISQIVGVLG